MGKENDTTGIQLRRWPHTFYGRDLETRIESLKKPTLLSAPSRNKKKQEKHEDIKESYGL